MIDDTVEEYKKANGGYAFFEPLRYIRSSIPNGRR